MSKAIPTTYANVRFRSRLEAKWAAFFDHMLWPWEYEPIDLDGYIPDFVLPFEPGPLLVEVKPAFKMQDMTMAESKIDVSGWEHEAIVVGARLFSGEEMGEGVCLGSMRERWSEIELSGWTWCDGFFFTCLECGKRSLAHSLMTWNSRTCGHYDGNSHIDMDPAPAVAAWKAAAAAVQWRGDHSEVPW